MASLIDGAGIGYWEAQGTTTPAGSFTIEPQAIPQLRADLASIRQQAEQYVTLRHSGIKLTPLGSDPASAATAQLHNEKGAAAITAIKAYIDLLGNLIASLDQAAQQYGITEATNTAAFQSGAGG